MYKMFLKKLVILSVFCTSLAFASPAQELHHLLNPMHSFMAHFHQTTRNEKGQILQTSEGVVSLQKPKLFRWEIIEPEHRLLIADGKKVWDYDEELEQVTVQPLAAAFSKTPMMVLTGDVAKIEQDYEVTKREQLDDEKWFLLTPKHEATVQWLSMGFKNGHLIGLELLDQLGQLSSIVLKDGKMNKEIPGGHFSFIPPENVDVMDNIGEE